MSTIRIEPELGGLEKDFLQYCRQVQKAIQQENLEDSGFRDYRAEIEALLASDPQEGQLKLLLAKSIFLDVCGLGWSLKVGHKALEFEAPDMSEEAHLVSKDWVRQSQLIERDAQLREPSVRDFVQRMERNRLSEKGWYSIFSLMRDGRELAKKLSSISVSETGCESSDARLEELVDPYIQFVSPGERCEHTGLFLQDIWRYFRHTWCNAYKSLPGRSMMLLVRDAAAPNHPVIGIAALGSSVVQQRGRDHWISWTAEQFLQKADEAPSKKIANWIFDCLEEQLSALYTDDLRADGFLTLIDFDYPSVEIISKLKRESERAMEQHRLYPNSASTNVDGEAALLFDWEAKSKTDLFRSKRASMLATLLDIRRVFKNCGFESASKDQLKEALGHSTFRRSITQLLRMKKATHVGINMMDIVVCGAVPPYTHLLGGKLVCMLLCSPEVTQAYKERYNRQVSIIASSMAGRCIIREPQLVLLCTTSLYGVSSSQYNRVRIPLAEIGQKSGQKIEYKKIAKSVGFGTYHISKATVALSEVLISRHSQGRKVNSIFGEGVNPRMRKIRGALELIGFPSDQVLRHENVRIVYGIALADNFRDVLLGMSSRPRFYIDQRAPLRGTKLIAAYWRKRWLSGRIQRDGVLESVAEHTLAYPITHGARIPLPHSEESLLDGGA